MTALVSFERVFEVLDLKPLIAAPEHPRALPDGPLDVAFEDVVFAYPSADKVSLASLEEVAALDGREGTEVLHGVSFRAEPGQTVALVGSSGAGKSTIAALLPRLYDTDAGAVRIGGQDVRDLDADTLRDALGMVTQDGHLFHESVRANLLLARPAATEEELWDALRRARLDGLVASLPDGLDTVVGERGYRLSGGERQRMTIARLLLARPRVVILDEATAHLDNTSEAAVQEALAEALDGRTALVIAHRLSTVRTADRILVVEDGRIVEQGTHTDLLAREGRYAELYRTQFAPTEAGRPSADRAHAARPPGTYGGDRNAGPAKERGNERVPDRASRPRADRRPDGGDAPRGRRGRGDRAHPVPRPGDARGGPGPGPHHRGPGPRGPRHRLRAGRRALRDGRREGLAVAPLCPYVAQWAQRHPDRAAPASEELLEAARVKVAEDPSLW